MDARPDGASLASSPRRREEPDPRTTLSHVLTVEPSQHLQERRANDTTNADATSSASQDRNQPNDDRPDGPKYTATTTTTRRNANGTLSSVFSGNKIKHLKKEDGEPLWRKDIQYDFLRHVFEDDKRVFTKFSDGTIGHTFADIYIDAMANSSKCSKVLKDKLLMDREAAKCIAMVCLLVNVGRMNTTLNFFPEMRAQLRTYHSIPSLQANQDASAYKQLQDAPRLKSILKGATEDVSQPTTIEEFRTTQMPRSTPVNLIFILSQYAPKVSEIHFTTPRDFFDLVTRGTLSSRSRAKAFLWLIWWYAESDFSREAALHNPFGAGISDELGAFPIKIPPFEHLSEEQANLENVDPDEEVAFGDTKRQERMALLSSDGPPSGPGKGRGKRTHHALVTASEEGTASPGLDRLSPVSQAAAPTHSHKRSKRTELVTDEEPKYYSDRTRSASPPPRRLAMATPDGTPGMRIKTLLNEETPPAPPDPPRSGATASNKGVGRGNWPRKRKEIDLTGHISYKPKTDRRPSSEVPYSNIAPSPVSSTRYPALLDIATGQSGPRTNPPVPPDAAATEQSRRQRVGEIVTQRLKTEYRHVRKWRQKEGALFRCWRRLKALPSGYDTDEDERRRPAGFFPVGREPDDFGEELDAYAGAMRRAIRVFKDWEGEGGGGRGGRGGLGLVGLMEEMASWRSGDYVENGGIGREVEGAKADAHPVRDLEGDEEVDEVDREILGGLDVETDEEADDELVVRT